MKIIEDKENRMFKLQLEAGEVVKHLQAFKLNLDLSGILFKNAMSELDFGVAAYSKFQIESRKYKASYKRALKKNPIDSDDFLTQMIPKIKELETFYEPVVRHLSTAKILFVSCAEIYICEVAETKLKGKELDSFYRIPLNQKWNEIEMVMGLQKKLNNEKFPLKTFTELVKQRNKIVHFKGLKEEIEKLEIPNFIATLNLTPQECIQNYKSVVFMIQKFSLNWKGSYGPDWLYSDEENDRVPCFYRGNRLASMVLG